MKYEELTIEECLDLVNETLFLPDIQRPYVWEEEDIYLLFDSICRDYPINTVLFWDLKKKTLQDNLFIKRFQFLSERFQENQLDTSPLQRDQYFLAIDGQQRITSLYLTLEGNYRMKVRRNEYTADLYYNFDSGVEENEDGILYEFKFFPHTYQDFFTETLEDKKNETVTIKNWIRVKFIYSISERKDVLDSIKERIQTLTNQQISNTKSNVMLDLWFKLKQDKLISFYRERTQDYDKVLDIFVRTNSGGEKLSYSDLLFSYIKLHWNDAREKFSELLKSLNEAGRFKFSHDFILKTILFIHANDQEQLKYRTNNFRPSIIQDTRENWDSRLAPAIKLTKDLLVSRFQLPHDKLITSYNALIPIIYFNYKFGKKGIGEESDKITTGIQISMREWVITSMLTGVFGGQSDGILNKGKKALEENADSGYFPKEELFNRFNEAKPALTLRITPEIISRGSYNSVESNLVLSLLYKNTVDLAPLLDDNKPQQDHIFSQKELKDAGIDKEKINSLYNIRWVSAADNRTKSDESFNEWFTRLGRTVIKKHFIPDGTWSVANYDDFLEARKNEFVTNIIGDTKQAGNNDTIEVGNNKSELKQVQ